MNTYIYKILLSQEHVNFHRHLKEEKTKRYIPVMQLFELK